MIKKRTCYTAVCDACGEQCEDELDLNHFDAVHGTLKHVRTAGWWATADGTVLCDRRDDEHLARAREIAASLTDTETRDAFVEDFIEGPGALNRGRRRSGSRPVPPERLAEIRAADHGSNGSVFTERPNSATAHRHELLTEIDWLAAAHDRIRIIVELRGRAARAVGRDLSNDPIAQALTAALTDSPGPGPIEVARAGAEFLNASERLVKWADYQAGGYTPPTHWDLRADVNTVLDHGWWLQTRCDLLGRHLARAENKT